MINIVFSQDRKIRGLNRGENFSLSVVETPVITPYSTTDLLLHDMNYKKEWLEYTIDDFRVDVTPGSLGAAHTYSLDERTVADVTVDQSGNITSNTDVDGNQLVGGLVFTQIDSEFAGAKVLKKAIPSRGRQILRTILSYAAGSLSDHARTQIDGLISGKTAGAATQEYWQSNNSDVDAPAAVLNPNRFVAGVDLGALSAMRTNQLQDRFPVSLISSNHAITTTHVNAAVGQKLVFMRTDGTFSIVTVDAIAVLGDDLSIAYFSTSVTGITPFKLMQTGWDTIYAPTIRDSETQGTPRLPVISKRFNDPLGVDVSWVAISAIHRFSTEVIHKDASPVFGDTLAWWNEVTGGDSGSPVFMVINNEPILITHHTAVDQGNSFAKHLAAINTAMNDLAGVPQGTYVVQHPDLSEFIDYSA